MASMLTELSEKVAAGGRLSLGEARQLLAERDPVSLGLLADEVRRRHHGSRVTYLRVCVVESAGPLAPEGVPPGAAEVRLLGRPHDARQVTSRAAEVVAWSSGVAVTAYSLADLEQIAGDEAALADLLRRLEGAGVAAVAEVPIDRLAWGARSVSAAAAAGLLPVRVTVEAPAPDPLDAIARVEALQEATGAVRVFAPLPRTPPAEGPTTGYDDVCQLAMARLVLDVPSVQVDWTALGRKLAQVALLFGVDDLDGVPPVDAADLGPRRTTEQDVLGNIRAAGFSPVARDVRFEERRA